MKGRYINMKCPFRKQVITAETDGRDVTEEYYMPCYKEQCPYYVAEAKIGDYSRPGYCSRCSFTGR